ncbi:MAG: alpha/beta hydrolase [bacterium]
MFKHVSKFWSKIPKKVKKYSVIILATIVVIATLFVSYLGLKPIKKYDSKSVTKLNYQESKTKFTKDLTSKDTDKVSMECKSKLLEHNKKTEKVVIMFHGFTNCPAQFDVLGKQLYDQGYNVLIPRIPHHGMKDTLTTDLENLKVEELVEQIQLSVSIASGLGGKISTFGISGGAVMAAYAGYFYNDVKNVFIAAPIFTPQQYAAWQLPYLINLVDTLPNQFVWWDDTVKEKIEGPKYAYPRFALKAVNAFITLSYQLKVALENKQVYQDSKRLVLMTTEKDPAVNNTVARYLIDLWSNNPDTVLVAYQFSSQQMPIHDFIDPNQKKANTGYIYPIILDLFKRVD